MEILDRIFHFFKFKKYYVGQPIVVKLISVSGNKMIRYGYITSISNVIKANIAEYDSISEYVFNKKGEKLDNSSNVVKGYLK